MHIWKYSLQYPSRLLRDIVDFTNWLLKKPHRLLRAAGPARGFSRDYTGSPYVLSAQGELIARL